MKIKKKVICFALGGMIAVWMLLGLLARRGALYLMGDDRSILSRSDEDVPCLGIRFYSMSQGNSIRWLNESECKVLWQRILGLLGGIRKTSAPETEAMPLGCLPFQAHLFFEFHPRGSFSLSIPSHMVLKCGLAARNSSTAALKSS